jgi:hypothetical protein
VANVFVFLNGLRIGDQIGTFETSIASLKEENTDLEKKVYESQSFTNAASMAAAMNFTKKTNPVYIDTMLFAKN